MTGSMRGTPSGRTGRQSRPAPGSRQRGRGPALASCRVYLSPTKPYQLVAAMRQPGERMPDRPSFMELALAEAERAAAGGEVPVGAALVAGDGAVLAVAGNRIEALS